MASTTATGSPGWPASRANSFDIAKQLKASGTTLSVIGVGEGRDGAFNYGTYTDDEDDTDFLRELAAVGGGRYYRTTDAKQLRGLFVQDARRLLDNHAREEDFHLKLTGHLAALDGVDMEPRRRRSTASRSSRRARPRRSCSSTTARATRS